MRRRIRLTESRLKNLVRKAIRESIADLSEEEINQEISKLIQQLKQKGYTYDDKTDLGFGDGFVASLGHGYYIDFDYYDSGMAIYQTDEDYTEPSYEEPFFYRQLYTI